MSYRFTLLVLFVLCVLLIAVTPSFAQELTPDTTPEATVIVVDSDGTVTISEDTLEAITENERFMSWTNIVYGVIFAIAGGGTFAFMLSRLDKRSKDEIERNYLALSPQWQNTILKVLETADTINKQVGSAVQLGRELTDGRANTDPTQTHPPITLPRD